MMSIEQRSVAESLPLVLAEYLEMPGLILTKPQVQRLWRLDPAACDVLLDELVAADFLVKTPDAAYGRAEPWSR